MNRQITTFIVCQTDNVTAGIFDIWIKISVLMILKKQMFGLLFNKKPLIWKMDCRFPALWSLTPE